MGRRTIAVWTSAIIAVGLVWWFILPPALGGRTTLFVTRGVSMQPYIHQGDLALLHKKSHYEVGDIIAFKAKSINAISLHRIIAIDSDGRYTTQGDANPQPDLDHPTASEVFGKLDHLYEGAGGLVKVITSKPVRLVGIALIGWSLWGAFTSARRDDDDERREKLLYRRLAMMATGMGRNGPPVQPGQPGSPAQQQTPNVPQTPPSAQAPPPTPPPQQPDVSPANLPQPNIPQPTPSPPQQSGNNGDQSSSTESQPPGSGAESNAPSLGAATTHAQKATATAAQLAAVAARRSRDFANETAAMIGSPTVPRWAKYSTLAVQAVAIVLAAASVLVLSTTISKSAVTGGDQKIMYTMKGKFNYSAQAKPGGELIYVDGQVQSGEPIYLSLVDDIFVTYAYDFTSMGRFEGTATYTTSTVLKGASGWKHTISTTQPTAFDGKTLHTSAKLDLAQMRNISRQVQQLTKVNDGSYQASIDVNVQLDGTLSGQKFSDSFPVSLNFTSDSNIMKVAASSTNPATVAQPGSDQPDPPVLEGLTPTKTNNVSVPKGTENTVTVAGKTLTISELRKNAYIGIGIALVLFAIGSAVRRKYSPDPEDMLSRATFEYNGMFQPRPETSAEGRFGLLDADGQPIPVQADTPPPPPPPPSAPTADSATTTGSTPPEEPQS